MAKLNRALGPAACVFFGVGSILGAGIYTLIGKVAGLSGNMIWVAFLISSVCALMTAFSYAELSSAFPKAGGEYQYAQRAFGKTTGIIMGVVISLNGIIVGATVAIGFAGYLETLLGINTLIGALGIIILLFGINISGIRESSVVNIIFTLIEVGGLVFIIVLSVPHLGDVNYLEMPPGGGHQVIAAGALAFFAFVGFEEIVKLSEETRNPEKNIPRALFIASIIVIVMYTIVAICAVSVIPYQQLGESNSPLADIASESYGNNGVILISVIALFATSNTILSNMIGSSRVLLNMSTETKMLKPFAFVSEKRKTPVMALVLVLAVMAAFALIGNIETVARISTLFIFTAFILINLCVIVLRIKEKALERPYRIPFNIKNIPVTSVLGIVLTAILLGYSIYGLARLNIDP